jgi:hypothetical protein
MLALPREARELCKLNNLRESLGESAPLSFNTFQHRRLNLSGIAPALAPANVRYCPKADKRGRNRIVRYVP